MAGWGGGVKVSPKCNIKSGGLDKVWSRLHVRVHACMLCAHSNIQPSKLPWLISGFALAASNVLLLLHANSYTNPLPPSPALHLHTLHALHTEPYR